VIVIAHKPGRLGNQLFLFAHLIAFSLRTGQRIANPAFDEYAHLFLNTRSSLIPTFPPTRLKVPLPHTIRRGLFTVAYVAARAADRSPVSLPGVRTIHLEWGETLNLDDQRSLRLLARRGLTFTQGWGFRDHAGVARHTDTIRSFLRPVPSCETAAKEVVSRARRSAQILVGVHLRQRDYRSFENGLYFFTPRDYRRIVESLLSSLPKKSIAFLLCSDAPISTEVWAGLDCRMGLGRPLEDLLSLSLCDYIVGPPSTFSMWASYYGGVPLFQVTSLDQTPRSSVIGADAESHRQPAS
jgi:hypothetical protein